MSVEFVFFVPDWPSEMYPLVRIKGAATMQLRSYCRKIGNAAGKRMYLVTKGLETGANLSVQLRIPGIM